ncbi:MAG: glycoside hydrolase family 32 protein [Clostridiaceae bacterium]|nr:glycoside hydrolase family 32 protein [Clostridiaceae bacterium]
MKIICDKKYLLLPVKYQGQNKNLSFFSGKELVFDLDAALDPLRPDYVACINLERFAGMILDLIIDPATEFTAVLSNDKLVPESVCQEPLRPGFHFSAHRGWLNDPNGLVRTADGLWHLFFQHNPAGPKWGNMHWGHAVSTDLMSWRELDCALYPDCLGTMFSGSAIIDRENRAGFGRGALLLFYTAAGGTSRLSDSRGFTQCIAVSRDNGKTFEKYNGNPILDTLEPGNRDPRVTFDEKNGCAVMALYLIDHRFALLRSEDFIHWDLLQRLELDGDDECPDFYPLAADGNENDIRWVFGGAHGRYCVGRFDGSVFVPEQQAGQLEYGPHAYAAQTWDNPGSVGPGRIRIAWNRYELQNMPFNGSMTFPCALSLRTLNDNISLCAKPIDALLKLYKETVVHRDINLQHGQSWNAMLKGKLYDLSIHLAYAEDSRLQITLFGLSVQYDAKQSTLSCMEHIAPLSRKDGCENIRLLIDVQGIEIFGGEGEAILCHGFAMDYDTNLLEITAEEGNTELRELSITELNPTYIKESGEMIS